MVETFISKQMPCTMIPLPSLHRYYTDMVPLLAAALATMSNMKDPQEIYEPLDKGTQGKGTTIDLLNYLPNSTQTSPVSPGEYTPDTNKDIT